AAAQPLTNIVLAIWMIGVIALSIRLLGGWLTARRVTRRQRRPVTAEIQAMAARLAERLALRRVVDVVESAGVAVPIMVGWLKPVIVLPTSVISGFTPEQVEALIVHELAHIRRNDYLVNLLQAAVETVLFYHPAVWWVSSRIRTEREHCCDDVAVTICDRLVYARALSDLAALATPSLAMAASNGSLVERVRRILGREAGESNTGTGWLPVFLILAVMAPALPATLRSADQSATPPQTATPPARPVTVATTAPPAVEAETVVAVEPGPAAPQKQTAAAVTLQTQTDEQRAAEIRRLEELLSKLAEQQRETMGKQFDLAIAANEQETKAHLDELVLKLKSLEQELARSKRMVETGLASDDTVFQLQQQLQQAQRELELTKSKGDMERSRLQLDRTQADQKREYDMLIQQYAKLKEYADGWKIVPAEVTAEIVSDPNAVAQINDVVQLEVAGEGELPAMNVEPDGTIRVPFAGTITVKGLTTRQIADAVAKRLTDRKLATNPKVSVTLRRR
ncbi:MAG TPA: M56 family metallopeptidase, partial [Vicinamibacterales bacterium]|nr:M56 family metallopeptidase [Vicinamibacterales bacterium]